MEILLEIIMEMYLEIAEILVPDAQFKKWQRVALKVLSVLVSCAVFFLVLFGIVILVEEGAKDVTGIALLSTGCAILGVQLILFFIALLHENKTGKRKKAKEAKLNSMLDDDIW